MTTLAAPHPQVSIAELISQLDQLSQGEPSSLAFDGDGTLWSGDVSDDVFTTACRANWFLDAIRPLVTSIAREHGIEGDGTIGEFLLRLFQSEKQGALDEQRLFEIMTWCYAGRSIEEVSGYAARTLAENGLESRLRWQYRPLLDWARSHGHSCWLVTASPWPIVRVAGNRLGFSDDEIIAACPNLSEAGVVEAGMRAPVPYREQKVIQLNARRKQPRLLAAFGDSQFDLNLLAAAELPVAVTPKPALSSRLASLEKAVVLML